MTDEQDDEDEAIELGVWTSKNGKSFTLEELEEGHLNNIIAKIEREADWRKKWLPVLLVERERREELRENRDPDLALSQEEIAALGALIRSQPRPTRLRPEIRFNFEAHRFEMSVQAIMQILDYAQAAVSERDLAPSVPDGRFEVMVVGDRSKEMSKTIQERIAMIGWKRLWIAMHEPPAQPPILTRYEHPIKGLGVSLEQLFSQRELERARRQGRLIPDEPDDIIMDDEFFDPFTGKPK